MLTIARLALASALCCLSLAFLALTSGCTPAARWTALRDGSGAICAIVVQASDPALAPLCSTVPEILDVVKGLAGVNVTGTGVVSGLDQDTLYRMINARRAAGR